ncbi:MAG: molecular chaperone DnaK [Candidatus Thermoplasmatota archaeon]|jgi:molecular chaperone DnaK|nr:molecular chaperone DnaK [Candidatus Thermoplasmatota archaeon]MCL5790069.1 molecular chaperone DnaK [Candidatus Thermoplasmatota archaeon]
MEKILGIDLGTSNSQAAVMIAGKPVVLPSSEGTTLGGKAFPSYVAFTKNGELLIGEPARRQALTNPEGTVYAFKRRMGENYKFKIRGKEYTPQQLSGFLLQKIKDDAEKYLGEKVSKAVITVPAYFNDNQRQATKDAGAIAGLDVVRIINEPTAAALAYGLDKTEGEHRIMVFDLGGGTLDVTIMEFSSGVYEVLSTSGDTKLGGTDMDEAVINYLASKFQQENGIDLRKDKNAYIRLKDAAEKAKIELSTSLSTEVNLPYITSGADGPKHLLISMTRADLENLVRPIMERARKPIEEALKGAKISASDISKVILVGGPTRMPMVKKFVEDIMGKKVESGVDPMECVAIGASIQGAVLAGEVKGIVLLDVTPLTLSIETLGGVATPLIAANTTIPTKKSQVFSTAADNQTAVEIIVVQGERPMAKDNTLLGRFMLDGIPPAPRGMPQIEVTFDIDSNGILNVTAKDLATNKQRGITITSSTKLSKEEINRMKEEAKKYEEEDRKKKEEIETINGAESLAYSTEKTMSDYGDKIPQDIKDNINGKLKDLKDEIQKKDVAAMKEKMDVLTKEIQKIGEYMYKNVKQEEQQSSGAEEAPPGPNPGETEIHEDKENKEQ